MFKKTAIALCAPLTVLSANAQSESNIALTDVYYGRFKLEIPTASLADAKIFSVDGPVIKFSDLLTLAGTVITRELLQLPADFDLALYPRYILGLESTDLLPENLQEQLSSALPRSPLRKMQKSRKRLMTTVKSIPLAPMLPVYFSQHSMLRTNTC